MNKAGWRSTAPGPQTKSEENLPGKQTWWRVLHAGKVEGASGNLLLCPPGGIAMVAQHREVTTIHQCLCLLHNVKISTP